MTTTLATPILWAQRSDRLFITVNLQDIKDEIIDLTQDKLTITCTSDGTTFSSTINFFKPVNKESSKMTILGFSARFVIFKQEVDGEYWPRLTKEGGKHNHINADWSKFIDPEEENQDSDKGLGKDWDTSMMQDMGGMGEKSDMNKYDGEDDSDDENQNVKATGDLEDEEEIDSQKTTKKEGKPAVK